MRPLKGLNKDSDERSQPEGTYREALNGTLDEELGVLRREKGLEQAGQFVDANGDSETLRGHIILDSGTQSSNQTGNVILFLHNTTTNESRIVEWHVPSDTRIEHLTDGGSQSGGDIEGTLDFNEPIQAVYRKLETGDTVLYWTDGKRPPRFLNLESTLPASVQDLSIFGKIESRLEFEVNDVKNFGGNLKGGTYQLAFAYVDQDGSTTNYFFISNPININSREGFGVKSDQPTSKSIEFTLKNVDTDYPFIRVVAIKGTRATILPDISITDSELTYTFTGNENGKVGSIDEVLIDEASYKTAGVIQDHEGTLYMADLTKRDRVDFQRHANDVTLKAVTKPVTDLIDTDEPLKAFTEPEFSAIGTYKRGEVYAFYISYLLEDGSETPAFHIPGPGDTTTSGGTTGDPFKADIIVNTDLPSPSEAQATGNFDAKYIGDEASKATHNAITINGDSNVNTDITVDYLDDNGVIASSLNISISQGDTPTEIAQDIVQALNNDSTFSSDFTAGTGASGVVTIESNSEGSQWNGYDVEIRFANGIDYTNQSGTTSGGQDSQSAPTHEISVSWDGGSTTVSVGSLTVPMTETDVANAYVTALNNDSTFSSNFTASHSSGTVTITADQNGTDYNADIVVDDTTNGNQLHSISLTGGYATGEDLPLEVRVYDGASYTSISGLTAGMTRNNAASQIQSELNSNGPSGFSYSVTDNVVTIEDTDDRSIGEQTPALRSPFTLGVTTSSYSSGGSDAKKAKAKITIQGDAPSISASPAAGTLEAESTPQDDGEEAAGDLIQIGSSSTVKSNFDAIVKDDNGNVVANVSVQIFDGQTPAQIAERVANALQFNSTITTNWTVTSPGDIVRFEANNPGTQYNGYTLSLQNFSVSQPFFYNQIGSTAGGENTGGDYGQFQVDITYDGGGQSITVSVTIGSNLTKTQVAGEIVVGLNNDSSFSSVYTATDNGDGTFTIESDSNDSTYNGSADLNNLKSGTLVDYTSLTGGNSGSDDIDISVYPHPGATETELTVPQQHPQNSIAFDIYQALVNNSAYTGSLTFILNTNEITIIDESQTSSLNGDSPYLVNQYNIPHSTEEFSGGGSLGSGGGSGNLGKQRSEIGSGHPLSSYESEVSGTLRNFHVDAEKFQDGFSYWEQQGEVYPDKERWDIVDETGTEIGSVRDRPIRHHRFPEINEEPHLSEDLNDPSNPTEIYLFGIRAEDVHVPDSIKDEVVGYKIYYAKKDPNERLVLDQSLGIRGWLDDGTERLAQQRDNIFTDDVWAAWGWPPYTDFDNDDEGLLHKVDHNLLQLHPFEAMRKGMGVQGVTHVKIVGLAGVGIADNVWNQFNERSEIRNAKGVSYIDQNERDVSLEQFGFSYNYDNLLGESKLIIETDKDIDRDSPTAGLNENIICDICQLKVNVHRPYDNQELVSTGFVGDIDEDINDASAPDPPVIYGGDINIEPWFFKAHTLLALADPGTVGGGTQNEWWNENTGNSNRNLYSSGNDGEELFPGLKTTLFGSEIEESEREGLARAMREIIGDTFGIKHLPIAWGQLWWEIVETRDHPWFRIEGEGELETFKPASNDFIANPNLGDIPQELTDNSKDKGDETYRESKWIFDFFVRSDNWFGYNEEYSKQNIIDTAFPFRVNEQDPTEFFTRVIRSATIDESGERSAWRTFLQEDYIDLAQDRGRVINISPIGSNILIHTTEALFQTRADQRIKTTEQNAFVGSGDLFQPKPREIISLDEGYGGLTDFRAAQGYENGYIFVDREAGKVFIFDGQQPREISDQGMRKFFRDNLTPSSIPRVGYDPHTGRIFVSDKDSGWNYSFHPGLKAWVSNHSFQADYFFNTRDHLYTSIGDTIYRVSTGTPGVYEQSGQPFEIEYIQSAPQPESQIVVSLIIDSRVLDSGVVIPDDTFDQFRIRNSYQDTKLTQIRPKTDENGSLRSNYNARLTDQAWKINEIRHDPSGPELTVSNKWKEKRRLADNFHRVKLVYDTDGRVIEVFFSALVTRASRR